MSNLLKNKKEKKKMEGNLQNEWYSLVFGLPYET